MESETIITNLRVVSEAVKPFSYFPDQPSGEVIEVKATGVWGEHGYPVSLHITVMPGCGAIPLFGDELKITIERA